MKKTGYNCWFSLVYSVDMLKRNEGLMQQWAPEPCRTWVCALTFTSAYLAFSLPVVSQVIRFICGVCRPLSSILVWSDGFDYDELYWGLFWWWCLLFVPFFYPLIVYIEWLWWMMYKFASLVSSCFLSYIQLLSSSDYGYDYVEWSWWKTYRFAFLVIFCTYLTLRVVSPRRLWWWLRWFSSPRLALRKHSDSLHAN